MIASSRTGVSPELSAAPGRGRFTIPIASVASGKSEDDTAAAAITLVQAAEEKGFAGLQQATADWWHAFWRKGAVYLHSDSAQADFVEANYDYFLYLMGASSRGDFPLRFGGMLRPPSPEPGANAC